MGRRNRFSKKKMTGLVIGALVVLGIGIYVYRSRKNVAEPGPGAHAAPRVGRGYGATPYGAPAGRLGTLRTLSSGGKQGCSCSS